jgi:hypothetical protein
MGRPAKLTEEEQKANQQASKRRSKAKKKG